MRTKDVDEISRRYLVRHPGFRTLKEEDAAAASLVVPPVSDEVQHVERTRLRCSAGFPQGVLHIEECGPRRCGNLGEPALDEASQSRLDASHLELAVERLDSKGERIHHKNTKWFRCSERCRLGERADTS